MAGPRRADQPPRMRSSVACARCRRSKVKCINNGMGSSCKACETTGRECTYPQPSVGASGGGGGGVRRESGEMRQSADRGIFHDTPKRQRPRKVPAAVNNVSTKESMRALVDALDPNLLTPQVWIELFEIWQLHFSTDLPFIHPPTFLTPLRQMQMASIQPQDFTSARQTSSSLPPASPLLLLGFLALTAKFHEKLVAHHSPPSVSRPSNPRVASQYYAAACKSRLAGNSGDGLGLPNVQRIQALLMLVIHEWSNCDGIKAWTSSGVAIRYAQILGLQYQNDLDDEPQARSQILALEAAQLGIGPSKRPRVSIGTADDFIEQETRRRIFWSCFNIDRYLSSGKYRPQMLSINNIRLQLPSSERAFLFGEKVRTALLSEDQQELETRAHASHGHQDSTVRGGGNGNSVSTTSLWSGQKDSRDVDEEQNGRWETGNDEGISSRYIKVIDLYGHIIRWACGGGRRCETLPPWDAQSHWYSLQARLSAFEDGLPRDLTLSQANTQAHISSRTSTSYTLIHSVLLLCKVMLHREYVPFAPLRCVKPEGPVDLPTFPSERYQTPRGFWEESAKELFRSARKLMELVQTCREWDVLTETPMVGFAIYTVAFMGVYAINFPWMDPDGYMCKRGTGAMGAGRSQSSDADSGAIAARQALAVIGMMRKRWKMADGWFLTISHAHKHFTKIKKDFRRNARALVENPQTSGPLGILSLRDGSLVGGLEESKMIEVVMKEFVTVTDEDMEMADAPELGESSTASIAAKSDGYAMRERSAETGPMRQDAWNAINNTMTASQTIEPTTNGTIAAYTAVARPIQSHSASAEPSSSHAGQHQHATMTGLSPQTSPNAQNQADFPPHLPQTQATASTLQASTTLQQQQQTSQSALSPPMTAEQVESWLENLETRFGADDVTAFVEGTDWRNWAIGAAGFPGGPPGVGGWLSAIWNASTN